MQKLDKYLLKDFLTTFTMAMLLITFAFMIGGVYKAIDFMAKGLPAGIIGRFILFNLPYSLAYTIPISILFSTLLLFGRISADSELNAMRSSGLSLWQIASPVILFSLFMTGLCFYNNFFIYPATTYENRKLLKGMGVEDPIKLLEEGRFIRDFPGFMIYIEEKNKNRVRDLIIHELDKETGMIKRTVRARSGIMTADTKKGTLTVDLFNVRMETVDPKAPNDPTKVQQGYAENYPVTLDFNKLMGKKKVYKKRKNMDFNELLFRLRHLKKVNPNMPEDLLVREHTRDLVEFNQRICLSLSPFMYVLIAISLGITSHRKESLLGMITSLAIMFIYYIFIILSDAMDKYPQVHPWLIPWVPIVLGQIGGFLLLRRSN